MQLSNTSLFPQDCGKINICDLTHLSDSSTALIGFLLFAPHSYSSLEQAPISKNNQTTTATTKHTTPANLPQRWPFLHKLTTLGMLSVLTNLHTILTHVCWITNCGLSLATGGEQQTHTQPWNGERVHRAGEGSREALSVSLGFWSEVQCGGRKHRSTWPAPLSLLESGHGSLLFSSGMTTDPFLHSYF